MPFKSILFKTPLALNRACPSFYGAVSRASIQTLAPKKQSQPASNTTSEPQQGNVKYTHFGFQNVPENYKEKLVGEVFSNVASKYDVMNDAMSAGVHRLWKDHFIRKMAPLSGTQLLDMAGGTGDIAERFLSYTKSKHNDTTANVHLVDINPEMLEEGKKRFMGSQYMANNQVKFGLGNAEHLGFIEDNTYDVYTIAFGIRNCTHIDAVVKEAYRVLKPGGCFMCLEFSKVDTPIISEVYDFFSFKIIPEIGRLVANDSESYRYLVESIQRFPSQEAFADIIRDAGFTTFGAGYENLTFGVAAIHTGYKL